MERCILDTDIVSEVFRAKNPRVVEHAEAYRETVGPLTMSAVTLMEVIKGLHKRGRQDLFDRLLAQALDVQVLPFTGSTAHIAGRIYAELEQSGETIGRADPMIAATAIDQDLTLITGNAAHFQRIQHRGYPLRIEDWRE